MIGERDVKGIMSWKSIGVRLILGVKFFEVRECMEASKVISADTSIFDAISQIVEHDYVLIHDNTRRITGIVTTSDLSVEFRELAEPFLLLREIENHIRALIAKAKFTRKELRSCRDPGSAREIDGVVDLTFGEYIRLLEKEESWARLDLSLDRKVFIKNIDEIRQIRNDVVHFDPDGVTAEELVALQKCAAFLQKLRSTISSA
jgi:hypothetical protein